MSYIAKRTEGAPGAPLVFTFHGTGGSEDQFHGLAEELLPNAHVVSPRGDVSEMGAARFFRRTGEGVYDMADLAERTEAMAAFLRSEVARTEATWVIGFGYSNGANILASVVLSHPDIFQDIALLHPLIPWDPSPRTGLSGKRVLITAGQNDPICPAPQTQALANYFEAQGSDINLTWHEGGHEFRREEIGALQTFLSPVAV